MTTMTMAAMSRTFWEEHIIQLGTPRGDVKHFTKFHDALVMLCAECLFANLAKWMLVEFPTTGKGVSLGRSLPLSLCVTH